jgi:glycosyltransferase involved in cell wall biosynthesis
MKKILINTPSLNKLGGVANHYIGLKDKWSTNVIYNTIGSRYYIPTIFLFPFDLMKFITKLIILNPDIVVLNPSLQHNALKRDAIFLKLSKILNFKTVIFFHGWSKEMELKIDKNQYNLLKNYSNADLVLVLANNFKIKLREWGFTSPIELTTTKVDDDLVSNFDFTKKVNSKSILFLARIEKEKGVYIVLDTFKKLKDMYHDLTLSIVGDGAELNDVKKYIFENCIEDVKVTGRLSGQLLKNEFKKNSIYFFPTFHGEGMPTSLLEAMSFGLAVISRPVGGTKDFFSTKMGELTKSKNPEVYFKIINKYLSNENLLKEVSMFNHKYAKNNFLASSVAKQLENLFIDI